MGSPLHRTTASRFRRVKSSRQLNHGRTSALLPWLKIPLRLASSGGLPTVISRSRSSAQSSTINGEQRRGWRQFRGTRAPIHLAVQPPGADSGGASPPWPSRPTGLAVAVPLAHERRRPRRAAYPQVRHAQTGAPRPPAVDGPSGRAQGRPDVLRRRPTSVVFHTGGGVTP